MGEEVQIRVILDDLQAFIYAHVFPHGLVIEGLGYRRPLHIARHLFRTTVIDANSSKTGASFTGLFLLLLRLKKSTTLAARIFDALFT